MVLDTKWKRLDPGEKTLNIDSPDIYQMHAYAHAYDAARLILVYPWRQEVIAQPGIARTGGSTEPNASWTLRVDVGCPGSSSRRQQPLDRRPAERSEQSSGVSRAYRPFKPVSDSESQPDPRTHGSGRLSTGKSPSQVSGAGQVAALGPWWLMAQAVLAAQVFLADSHQRPLQRKTSAATNGPTRLDAVGAGEPVRPVADRVPGAGAVAEEQVEDAVALQDAR